MRKFVKTLAIAATLCALALSPAYADIVTAKLSGGTLTLNNGNVLITLKSAPAICGPANLANIATVIRTSRNRRVDAAFTPGAPCTFVCLVGPKYHTCGYFFAADVRRLR